MEYAQWANLFESGTKSWMILRMASSSSSNFNASDRKKKRVKKDLDQARHDLPV